MDDYKEKLKQKMDNFVHFVYKITHQFPREELYGSATQLRRAALSVILNYVEGFARRRKAVQLNFFEISYGSLKEAKYLLQFALDEKYINADDFDKATAMAEEIGAMLWTEIQSIAQSI